MDEEICLWKEMFLNKSSTFENYENWPKEHPLNKCVGCQGEDLDCRGYRHYKNIMIYDCYD